MPSESVVHVVDDDEAVRDSMAFLLRSAQLEVEAYESAVAFLGKAAGAAGCVVTDVRMPEMTGIELVRRLKELGNKLPVIVMTGHGDVPLAVEAMKAGAVDFIEKPFDEERLLAAIDMALAGAGHGSREREATDAARRIAALSRRERQVLDGLVAGHANKAIAHHLGISTRTAEVHRARMLERLGTRHTAEAIRLAVMATLAPPAALDETGSQG